ncbi:MAG: glycosyltransferase family 2 protein [Minisyncoccia bacterium]|jgi:glycosyltransferase involved in cell wall biosynthesis
MRKLSIIIPCYNESRTIEEIVRRVIGAPLRGWEREIIVVDDGSTDGTRKILQVFGAPITCIFQEKNGGKGTAVHTGLKQVRGDYVLIQDADLEYDPNEIQKLLAVIDKGEADVVHGSRTLIRQKKEGPVTLRLGVWFLTQMVNILYGLTLTDICTCYKLFPREAGEAFAPGGFVSDILFTPALARRGYRFAEVPISHHPRSVAEGKKVRYRDGFRAIVAVATDWFRNL